MSKKSGYEKLKAECGGEWDTISGFGKMIQSSVSAHPKQNQSNETKTAFKKLCENFINAQDNCSISSTTDGGVKFTIQSSIEDRKNFSLEDSFDDENFYVSIVFYGDGAELGISENDVVKITKMFTEVLEQYTKETRSFIDSVVNIGYKVTGNGLKYKLKELQKLDAMVHIYEDGKYAGKLTHDQFKVESMRMGFGGKSESIHEHLKRFNEHHEKSGSSTRASFEFESGGERVFKK